MCRASCNSKTQMIYVFPTVLPAAGLYMRLPAAVHEANHQRPTALGSNQDDRRPIHPLRSLSTSRRALDSLWLDNDVSDGGQSKGRLQIHEIQSILAADPTACYRIRLLPINADALFRRAAACDIKLGGRQTDNRRETRTERRRCRSCTLPERAQESGCASGEYDLLMLGACPDTAAVRFRVHPGCGVPGDETWMLDLAAVGAWTNVAVMPKQQANHKPQNVVLPTRKNFFFVCTTYHSIVAVARFFC